MRRHVICIRCSAVIDHGTPIHPRGDCLTAFSVCDSCQAAENKDGHNRYEVEAIEPERGNWAFVTIMLALVYWPVTAVILLGAFIAWLLL